MTTSTRSRRSGPYDGTSSLDVVRGVQVPRFMTAPNLDPRPEETAAAEVVRIARLCGIELDPWEQLVLRVALAEAESGLWEAFEVALVLARQNGKNLLLEVLELFWLFVLGELVAHTAQLGDTAKKSYERLLVHIRRAPSLSRQVPERLVRRSADDFSIATLDGAKIEFGPRSSRTGRGAGMDKVVFDEAGFLGSAEITALVPTMTTRDNPQLWYTASAGLVTSEKLRALRDKGRKGAERMAYFEWSSAATDDRSVDELVKAGVLDDPRVWAECNPSLELPRPHSISVEYVRGERQAMIDEPESFLRERLSVFDEPATAGRVISATAWEALANAGGATVGAAVFAVAVTLERDAASIVAAGRCSDGVPQVEVVASGRAAAVEVDPGDDDVAGLAWVVEFFAARRGATVALAVNGPAGGLAAKLEAVGANVTRVSDAELARGAQGLFDEVVARGFRHLGDKVLGDAVEGGRKRELGDGAWTWSRKSSAVNICPLEGATLALHVLSGGGGEPVFPEFDPGLHVRELAAEVSWPRYWAVRFGFLAPFVWQCWAEDPAGRLWLEHEMYRTHRSPQDMAAEIRALGLPRPVVLLCDASREERRGFERVLGRSARDPQGLLTDGLSAVSKRLVPAEDGLPRLLFSPTALVGVDPELAAASRPTCTTDEFPGYVWDQEKETPCDDGPGLECVRWVVAYVDLRARAGVRFV